MYKKLIAIYLLFTFILPSNAATLPYDIYDEYGGTTLSSHSLKQLQKFYKKEDRKSKQKWKKRSFSGKINQKKLRGHQLRKR